MADPTYIAGESLVAGNACYMKTDGRMWKALAPQPVEAICKSATLTTSSTGNFHPAGVITYGSWSGAGLPIYLSSTVPGLLTITEPTGIEDPQQIGITYSSTTMMWNIDLSAESVRKIRFLLNGSEIGTQRSLNFIQGVNATLSLSNNNTFKRVDATISGPSMLVGTGPFVSVKDSPYNAVGNESTNDTAAIQAAINSLGSTGGVVWFPKGSYKTTSSLSIPSNISLLGAGPNLSKIYAYRIAASAIQIQGIINVSITNLGIYSENTADSTLYGINIKDSDNITVSNCELSYLRDCGIKCEAPLGISDSSYNIVIKDNYVHHIKTSTMSGIIGIGIAPYGVRGGRIINNRIENVGNITLDWGIYGGLYSTNILISNNQIKDCYGGIQVRSGSSIEGNPNVIISDNIITGVTHIGIVTEYTPNLLVQGNFITYGSTQTSYPTGIWMCWAHVDDWVIKDNIIVCALTMTEGLIAAEGNRGVVEGNILYGNGNSTTVGIKIGGHPAADIRCHSNIIYNIGTGIYASADSDRIQITSNFVTNALTGTYLTSGCDYVLHRDNKYRNVTANITKTGATNVTDDNTIDW
jgi:parallel beta-helix repeat protein